MPQVQCWTDLKMTGLQMMGLKMTGLKMAGLKMLLKCPNENVDYS
jgi:hypothetical protein